MATPVTIGVDQSLTCTGVCIYAEGKVVHYNSIRTTKVHDCIYEDTVLRGKHIVAAINAKASQFDDAVIVLEGLSFNSKGNATRTLPMLLGILLSGLNKPFKIVTPSELKKFATGKGNAPKEAMLEAIAESNPSLYAILKRTTKAAGKFDIADAYWLSKYHER